MADLHRLRPVTPTDFSKPYEIEQGNTQRTIFGANIESGEAELSLPLFLLLSSPLNRIGCDGCYLLDFQADKSSCDGVAHGDTGVMFTHLPREPYLV